MANVFYRKFWDALGKGDIDLVNDDIRAVGVSGFLVPDQDDEFWSDLSANAKTDAIALTGKSFSYGVFNAADTTLTNCENFTRIILYQHTGDPATSPLICHLDSYAGLGVFGADGDDNVEIIWPAAGIFNIGGGES